ncbi:MAG TPA: hypothetical protein DD429_02805 [Clostridiaceae bacterium]|nr:hypothetical protein [Clostridiaceae bacterium]
MEFFKKCDIIILAAIVTVSLLTWFIYKNVVSRKMAKAEIYYNNQLVETVDLNKGEDKAFSIPQNKNVVFHLYKDGSICFEKSDCPDKICIRTGKLKNIGETAACIPNKIFIKIVPADGSNDDGLDAISGK